MVAMLKSGAEYCSRDLGEPVWSFVDDILNVVFEVEFEVEIIGSPIAKGKNVEVFILKTPVPSQRNRFTKSSRGIVLDKAGRTNVRKGRDQGPSVVDDYC